MKKHGKKKIRSIIQKAENEKQAVDLLQKRYKYLKSKQPPLKEQPSNQMKYIGFHLRKMGVKN